MTFQPQEFLNQLIFSGKCTQLTKIITKGRAGLVPVVINCFAFKNKKQNKKR